LWTGRRIVWRGGWFGDRHVEAGGWFVHSALTVPHRRRESLSVVLERLRLVWRGLRHLRVLRRWRALASVSPLVVLQVLWGRDGWHPHFHVLWFGSGDVDRLGFAGFVAAVWFKRQFPRFVAVSVMLLWVAALSVIAVQAVLGS
jgi:hypothetical protein